MPVGNGDAFDQATAKPYRVLAKLYPQDKAHFGNGGSNNSSLRSAGLRLREAVNQIGYKTVDYQEQPPLVPNWRPYVEEAKLAGVKAFQQLSAQDLTPLLTAANNVGWKLDWMLVFTQFYDPKTIAAASCRRRTSSRCAGTDDSSTSASSYVETPSEGRST